MAPLLRRLSSTPGVRSLVCVTAQHRQMLDHVLDVFAIHPDFDFNLMRDGQGLTYITNSVMQRLGEILRDLRPDRILVQGDTTTAMAASLAAFYDKVPVGHVEAGLRTGNMHSPWPEELNRRLITITADLHFPPTEAARQNLEREGVAPDRIVVTGNTVIDALLDAVEIINADPALAASLDRQLPRLDPAKRLILVTAHRRESFNGGIGRVARALLRLADRKDIEIIYPVHLNPNVQRAAYAVLSGHPSIHLIPPLDYLPFVNVMQRATLIITDSGGIQEEAPSLGKPVLVTRDTTERPEAIAAGTAELVGTDTDRLVARASRLLDDPSAYAAMSVRHNPYGDGRASGRIVEALLSE
ncbi:MAG: non-hydrolyzing UDP-N-acetylglucosamine 2-epimerase [Rhodopila sp.]